MFHEAYYTIEIGYFLSDFLIILSKNCLNSNFYQFFHFCASIFWYNRTLGINRKLGIKIVELLLNKVLGYDTISELGFMVKLYFYLIPTNIRFIANFKTF